MNRRCLRLRDLPRWRQNLRLAKSLTDTSKWSRREWQMVGDVVAPVRVVVPSPMVIYSALTMLRTMSLANEAQRTRPKDCAR